MFGKIQAVTIPKDPMTEKQRAEFAAFVADFTATPATSPVPGLSALDSARGEAARPVNPIPTTLTAK
jgi:hypothetical protein